MEQKRKGRRVFSSDFFCGAASPEASPGTRAALRKVRWPAPSFFRSRPLLCGTLCFVLGVALSPGAPYGAWLFVAAGAPLALSALCAAFAGAKKGWRVACAILALAGMLLLGVARGSLALRVPHMPQPGAWQAEGVVDGRATRTEKGFTFFLRDVRVLEEGEWKPIGGKLYCFYPTDAAPRLTDGQRAGVSGTAYLPTGQRNPGGFDQRMWLAQKGAHARMYLSAAPRLAGAEGRSLLGVALAVADALGERADGLFGAASPVVRAVLLGDQTQVPDSWYGWLRTSGVAHLLSVSGLNVGLWYLLLRRLLAPLPVPPGARLLLLGGLLCGYALLTGLSDSILRAAVMLLVLEGGRVARRKVDPLTSLALAALLILFARPLDLFAAGFQLSFGAMLGIVLLRSASRKALSFAPARVVGPVSVTLSAQAGILPALASWFGRVSLVGLATNLLAVPIAGLLLPTAATALALDAVWAPLGWLPAQAARGMVTAIVLLARLASGAPFAELRMGAFAWWTAAALLAGIFLCSTAVVWRVRTRLLAMAAAVCLALLAGYASGAHAPRYVQLDVGQALSGVLRVDGKTYVFDCGNEGSDLAAYLTYCGADVDGLFLSHPHVDHTGGLTELLDRGVRIATVYVPANADAFGAEAGYGARLAAVQAQGAEIVELAAGDALDLGGLAVEVLAPEREAFRGGDPNDRSMALLLTATGRKLLILGDSSNGALPPVDCDVMQVAHHGSRIAADRDFILAASPEAALVSAGRNSYGHPHRETLDYLAEAGARTYLTQESGALTVYLSGESIRVEAFCP